MQAIHLSPVIRACGPNDSRRPAALTIDETAHASGTWQLFRDKDGSLNATGPELVASTKTNQSAGASPDREVLGFLRLRNDAGRATWFFIPGTRRSGVNAVTPPLPMVLLQPGMLLSLADEFWVVSHLWSPEPADVTAELAEKECPVCGLELKHSTVATCLCGNVMHLERPNTPDDPEALNCFLTVGTCGSCQRPTSLEPQSVPDIPEPLLAQQDHVDAF